MSMRNARSDDIINIKLNVHMSAHMNILEFEGKSRNKLSLLLCEYLLIHTQAIAYIFIYLYICVLILKH